MAEANSRQTDIQKTKSDLLAAIREQIFLSDQVIKKVKWHFVSVVVYFVVEGFDRQM